MDRLSLLMVVTLQLAFCLCSSSMARAVTSPNIVFVLADDLGVNDLACYGRTEHRTPNLDQLAASGLRFTSAYTAQPICSPSRAALMTGKSPARLHLTQYLPGRPDTRSQKLLQPTIEGQLPLEETTVAEWLQREGYATGFFGKWHLGGKGFGPELQGFDTAVPFPANSQPSETEGGKSEFAITKAATEFIQQNATKPFFCYVAHSNPHIPLRAQPSRVKAHAAAFHPEYAAMVETLDESVGRLIAELDRLKLRDNTLFVFSSDNGGLHVPEGKFAPATHNSPYRAGKGFLYEGGLREPLIVHWPARIKAGREVATPVVLSDLVPTFLEAAGVSVAKTVGPLDGISLLPLMDAKPLPDRSLYWHFPHYTNQGGRPAGAIRVGEWKLIEQFEDGSLELYDLSTDPSESQNLADSESARAGKMQAELAAWRKRVGAQMPELNASWDNASHHQIYGQQDVSQLRPLQTAVDSGAAWSTWRRLMDAATKGGVSKVTPASGDIRLHARDAVVHATKMHYESASNKNVLGFWTNPSDWAEWQFQVSSPGMYEIEVQQGCGQGSGGATVEVGVDGQSLPFTVVDTGHFQNMIQMTIGQVKLAAGTHSLTVKPLSKPGVAVMDLRRVVLRPVVTKD